MSDEEEAVDSLSAAGGGTVVSTSGSRQQIFALPPVPPNQGPPSISLAYLIDFAVQRTFQDLTVLAELLPKKTDMERKISIVQFAHSTRQLFIRLLAVVRWAKSAGKIDLCTGISCFLDQQASIFVDTADRLFQLSREVLPQARLPAFQIPAAVDVLVLGSYPRLPACIKTRFVPDEAISLKEQTCVLRRLNQVLQHRLVFATVPLPPDMQNFTIRNGIVNFTVPGEFEASLTLLGEDANLPWSLLHIKILVEDYDIGEGTDLVHPFQVHYMHELVEARMFASENPIAELYDVVHTFCIYLQLDILFCQASKFVHDRMIDYVSVDEYVQGHKLTLTYWKSAPKRHFAGGGVTNLAATPYPGFNYKILIHVDANGRKKSLRVVHIPSADVRLPTLDDYNDSSNVKRSIENLLCDTILIRIRHRLVQLKQRLRNTLVKNVRIAGAVPALEIFLLEPLIETERLDIAINLFTGHFVCSVTSLGKTKTLEETERFLNLSQWHKIEDKLRDLKIVLLMERYAKTALGLPVVTTDTVPLLPSSTTLRFLSPIRLLLRFCRHEAFYLIVEFLPGYEFECKVRYFLLSTCSANAISSAVNIEKCREMSGVCEFVKPVTLLLLDADAFVGSRDTKHVKSDSCFSRDLAAVVTKCDQRIPFILLCEEFDQKGIKCQALREEEGIGSVVLNVLGFTRISSNTDKAIVDALWSNAVVRLSGRLVHDRNRLHWTFELITSNIPLIGIHQLHSYGKDGDVYVRMTVLHTSVSADGAPKCADELISAMCAFGRFYDLIVRFASVFKKYMHELCQVLSLSVNRLVLSYGPRRDFFVMLQWKQQESTFHLSFGTHAAGNDDGNADKRGNEERIPIRRQLAENPHSLMTSFIETAFNEKRDLAFLMQYLNDTIEPLLALQLLPQWPTTGVGDNQMQPLGHGHVFTILPVSGTVIRVMYKWHLCFEMQMMANGEVILRDCGAQTASVQQSPIKSASRLSPIVGFKSFFELHEKIAGTTVTNMPAVQPSSIDVSGGTGGSPSWPQLKQEPTDIIMGSPSKMRADSVKTASPMTFAAPSPAGGMVAPSPLSALTPLMGQGTSTQQQGPPTHGSMTPSPAPPNFAGMLTPSPAAGPASNAGMLMTPSPAQFILQSPAPAAVNSVSSSASSTAANSNAPPLSPAGPEPSPLSFVKSFASEASAAGAESKGNGGEFSNWGEGSTVASMTPITTAAPFAMENLPIMSSQPSIPVTTSGSSASAPSASSISTMNTEDWAPSAQSIIVSHASLRSACSPGPDGRFSLKEFLASLSALEKLSKQPNALPLAVLSGPGQATLKVGALEMKIHLDEERMTRLVLKVVNTVDCGDNVMWSDDDLRIMEQYFVEYVAPIQHQHAIATFLRFLLFSRNVHPGAPRSLVSLMRHQLQRNTTRPWSASLCLMLPPPHHMTPTLTNIGTAPVMPGMMAIMVNREQKKMLLWIKLTSNIDRKQKWIFPLLYDGESNSLTVFTGPAGAVQQQSSILTQYPVIGDVNSILQRHQNYTGDCSIWTSINALASSLSHQPQQGSTDDTKA